MSEIRDRDELILTVNRLMICAMEDIDSGRNEASPTTLDLVQRIEDTDAALRLALETANARIDLDNAVCLCGCPASEHEDYGEDGEQCEHEDHECIRVAPAVLEIVGRVRLALETATREAEEERRTAEAAVKFLGRIAEVTWEAGLPGGDREQTLKNVRALASRPAPQADAPPLPPGCTHDPSLVCLRCRVVIPMPAPPPDAAREAVDEGAAILRRRLDTGRECRDCGEVLGLKGMVDDFLDLLSALSSPAPAPSTKETKP